MMTQADVESLSYEEALAELDALIDRLEKGTVQLAESIAWYERGTLLAKHCEALLARTEQKVTQLMATDQDAAERPADVRRAQDNNSDERDDARF